MFNRISAMAALVACAASLAALAGAKPAFALTAQECSVKYQAAKTAGTLNGATWNQFRAQNCGADAAAAPAPAAAAPKAVVPAAPAATPAVAGGIAGAGREAEQARQKQCGAEWRANKETLKAQYPTWPKYFSACNTRIKTTGK